MPCAECLTIYTVPRKQPQERYQVQEEMAGLLSPIQSSGNPDIRDPEVSIRTMRQFPSLPATSQKFFYTTPDATFNAGGSRNVLEHIAGAEGTENFAYAEANRLGTQAAYLNVPHMAQKNICPLILPSAKKQAYGNEPFLLPFPHLRKGDIAFYLRLQQSQWEACKTDDARIPLSLLCKDWRDVKRCKMNEAMSKGGQMFVNLQVVNYILHGIQYYRGTEPYWRDAFWKGFGLNSLDPALQDNMEALCTHVVQWCMTPFGVVASDTHNLSDQGAAMVVDGRVEMMRNYWATFVDDADSDDLVSMQNERVYRDRQDQGMVYPQQERLNQQVGNKRRRKHKSGAAAVGSEDASELVLPKPGDELILILERTKVDGSDIQNLDRWAYMLPNFRAGGSGDAHSIKMTFPLQNPPDHLRSGGDDNPSYHVWQLVPSMASMSNISCWERKGFWRLGTVH